MHTNIFDRETVKYTVTLHSFRVAVLTVGKLTRRAGQSGCSNCIEFTEGMDRLWVWLILLCEFFKVLYNEFLMNFKMKKE